MLNEPALKSRAAMATEPVALLVMLASFGACFLVWQIRSCLPGGISELDERNLYFVDVLFAPPFALLGGWLLVRARRAFFRESIVFPVAMALCNVLFWAVALYVFKQETAYQAHPELTGRMRNVLLFFVATNAGVFGACLWGRRLRFSSLQRQVLRRVADDAYFAIPFAAAFAMGLFSNYRLARWPVLIGVGACGLPALVRRDPRLAAATRAHWVVDTAAIILIVGIVFNANYDFDVYHYSFFLGPTSSFLGGRRPLVDINCQYGVGVIYFLASVFKLHAVPLSYQGMSAVLSALGVIHFIVLYVLLRLCLRSQGHCFLALLVMLAVRVMGHSAYLTYPSLGPLRFIWGHLLLLFVALRHRFPSRAALWRISELFIVGATSVWSVEAFGCAMATFLALVFYEVALGNDGGKKSRLLRGLKSVGGAMLAIGVAHVLLAAEIRLHSGQWPHWSYYFAYVILYAKAGSFWALPITTWEPWAPIVLVYFVSLTALVARGLLFGQRTLAMEHKIVWGMTILGIVEFFHYIGRSHLDHLCVYMSELFVAAYWMDRMARASPLVPPPFRRSFLFCAYASAGLLFFAAVPGFNSGFAATALGHVAADRAITSPWGVHEDAPWRDQGFRANLRRDAIQLINKYQPQPCNVALFHEPRVCKVALFIEDYIRPTVLMQVGKALFWPMSLADQDSIEPTAKARILSFSDDLHLGDIIFVSDDVSALEQEILAGLKKRFRFSELETSSTGIKVVRLDPMGSERALNP